MYPCHFIVMLMDMASPPFGGYGRPPTVLCSALFYSRPVPGAEIILPYVTISVKQFSLPGRLDPPRALALGGSPFVLPEGNVSEGPGIVQARIMRFYIEDLEPVGQESDPR